MPTYTREEIIKEPARWHRPVALWFLPVVLILSAVMYYLEKK
jgi:hypothetical protein